MRRLPVALLAVLAVLVVATTVHRPAESSASFTTTTTTTARVTAAADWTPPTVSLAHPGATVQGTVTLTATATDAESGIAQVTIERRAVGATTWTTICTSTTTPYGCAWSTTGVTDGSYDLRARAVDGSGLHTTTDPVRTVVANTTLVVLTEPADVLRGSVPLTATLYNTGTVTYSVRIEYAVAGTTTWRQACSASAPAYTCTWSTTSVAHGEYDLRAVASAGSTTHVSAVVRDIMVDNLAPTVSLSDPGSPLSGIVTMVATADDTHSGVAQVRIQSAPAGTTSWTDLCTRTTSPYSCRVDTARLVDGTYDLRAVALDAAGNQTTSALVRNRLIDNTVSAVSLEEPAAVLGGTVRLTADATSTAGVTSVVIQTSPAGAGTWTAVCTDTTSPYTCDWDTRKVTDGLYDMRAVLTDGTGGQTTSKVLTGHRVDNNPVRGVDVQAVNGPGTAGRLDAGDVMTFVYSERIEPSTVTPGWTGAPLAVTVRLRDGAMAGLSGNNDVLDIQRTGSVVNLGSVQLNQNHINPNRTATFAATMTAETTTAPNGGERTTIRIVLGDQSSGQNPRTVNHAATMVWTPSGAVTDLFGTPSSTSPVTEQGTSDRDF